ncbi:MAG TPA: L-aspartate oxidase [Gammaproteobacteria bacterium]|nr:L-aspartate oxidase [Gammaproteobacteria bacterium]
MLKNSIQYDVLIIGSGAAGLSLALRLAGRLSVAVLSKSSLGEGSTLYAQGGIAAVLDKKDSVEKHIEDTLEAGAGLCDEKTVRYVVERGPNTIKWLLGHRVPFTLLDKEDASKGYHLTREGGHSERRVIHSEDATGKAIETTLQQQVRNHPGIQIYEHHLAIDLITEAKLGLSGNRCLGAYVLDKQAQRVSVFAAGNVILATGGASKAYLYTSNPDTSTGDGIAMAWRAGCRVANMEFNQFHPTCLYHPSAKSFLLSEAIRGEGGILRLADGTRFMPKFDSRADLAPRDVVARAIDHEMKRLGVDCVYLDISHKSEDFIIGHFPNIYARCLEYGYDMARSPIPVVPAAHYTCGGVMTDLAARTDLPGLYVIGESAYTGLHGANRMASNSLLECLVFAEAAASDILQQEARPGIATQLPAWDESKVEDSDERVVVSHNWDELRHFMWDYVGIVRTTKRLQRAKRRVDMLAMEINEYYGNFRISNDLIELRNLVEVADLIIRSALERKESRGLHYTLDYPERNIKTTQATVLTPGISKSGGLHVASGT